MLRRTTVGAAMVLALAALSACVDSMQVTPIPDVIDSPADFNNKFVKVEGTVAKTVVDAGTGGSTRYYVLETRIHREGKSPPYYVLKVLAPSSEIPEEGKSLWVKGTVEDIPGDDPILREKEREQDTQGLVWMIAFGAVGVVLVVLVIVLIMTLVKKSPPTGAGKGRRQSPGRHVSVATTEDQKQTAVAPPPPPQRVPETSDDEDGETRAATEAYLLIERGECVYPEHSGHRLIIYQDARNGVILGRGSKAAMRFKGKAVSREHATLRWYEKTNTFKIINTCNTERTWTTVDGVKLGPDDSKELEHDMRIQLGGEVELVFQNGAQHR